jgi:AcrR family transcriptional regulator
MVADLAVEESIMEQQRLYTIPQIAAVCGVSTMAIYYHLRSHQLPRRFQRRDGGTYRVFTVEEAAWIFKRTRMGKYLQRLKAFAEASLGKWERQEARARKRAGL